MRTFGCNDNSELEHLLEGGLIKIFVESLGTDTKGEDELESFLEHAK